MIWHITKREIHDHLTSLRFALTLGLVTLLMILNGIIFVGSDYSQRLSEYSQNLNWAANSVRESCKQLNELAKRGPAAFFKRPSPLAFCANDQEDSLPMRINTQGGLRTWMEGGFKPEETYRYDFPWKLDYVQDAYQNNSMISTFTALDWSFIIGVVMSFVAILFSFDAISGERERGTLKLMLSNSVSRGTVILGKLLGIFITLAVPMLIGMILSLIIVNISGSVPLTGSDWLRIGLMAVISLVYILLFIGLGLAVSSSMSHSSSSLLTLLLIWVVIVVLIPNTLGSVITTLRKIPSQRELQEEMTAVWENEPKRFEDSFRYGSPTQPNPDVKAIELWADRVTTRLNAEASITDEHLEAQFSQVRLARHILRFMSPAAMYNYVMESLSKTGFARHDNFVKSAHRYREKFVDFIISTDRSDPDSYHCYYLYEGLSSKPVDPDNVPRFAEAVSIDVSFESALTDLSMLILLSAVLFLVSIISFLRCSVR
jgi:ABC-type transport system involved in multi-copper enzyme maturation permease subunit